MRRLATGNGGGVHVTILKGDRIMKGKDEKQELCVMELLEVLSTLARDEVQELCEVEC